MRLLSQSGLTSKSDIIMPVHFTIKYYMLKDIFYLKEHCIISSFMEKLKIRFDGEKNFDVYFHP